MTKYFEVTGSWGNIIGVSDDCLTGKPDAAIDYFCDTFDLKEFFRGVEAREIDSPEDVLVTLDKYGVPIDEDE